MKHNHLAKEHLCPAYGCRAVVPGGSFVCDVHARDVPREEHDLLAGTWMREGFDEACLSGLDPQPRARNSATFAPIPRVGIQSRRSV